MKGKIFNFLAGLIGILLILTPIQAVQAKGGGGLFGGGFGIIMVVASVALMVTGVGAGLAAGLDAVISGSGVSFSTAFAAGMQTGGLIGAGGIAGMSAEMASNIALSVSGSMTNAFGVSAFAVTQTNAFLGISGVLNAKTLADSIGDITAGYNEPGPAAFEANTKTASTTVPISQGGGGATCPYGYYIASSGGEAVCVPDGYVSCAPINYPNAVCPDNSQCVESNGQAMCQTKSGTCVASSGQVCVSSANSCGMTAQGKTLCDGTCPALVPLDEDCPAPQITLSAAPSLTNPGSPCTVSWTVVDATTCSLSSDINDSVASTTLPTGSRVSPALTAPPTYTMLCKNGTVVTSQVSVKCNINPHYQDI